MIEFLSVGNELSTVFYTKPNLTNRKSPTLELNYEQIIYVFDKHNGIGNSQIAWKLLNRYLHWRLFVYADIEIWRHSRNKFPVQRLHFRYLICIGCF